MPIPQIRARFEKKKPEIHSRLNEFKQIFLEADNKKLFAELAFCLCTPQSRAVVCDKAIKNLEKTGILFSGSAAQIERNLDGVRFSGNKSKWIVEAREKYLQNLSKTLKSFRTSEQAREWIVENIKGIGMKEAGHYLRNIGFWGEHLAILDRHILKHLVEEKIIPEVPKSLTPKIYLEIEKKMKRFSERVGLSLYELDLFWWSEESGIVLK